MPQITIKRKILIVLGILVIGMIPIGILMLQKVNQLGHSIDVIMRENYRSVVICQQTIELLVELDADILYHFSDDKTDADFFSKKSEEIKKQWKEEISNATVFHEKELAEKTAEHLDVYLRLHQEIRKISNSLIRVHRYKKEAIPLSESLQDEITNILAINQNRMHQADQIARKEAENLFRAGIILFISYFIFLGVLGWLLTIWVQKPLCQLLAMSEAIASGNFSCVVQSGARDEIGRLMHSFNEMAAFLRSNMVSMENKIRYSEQISRDVLMTLPIPVAIFSKNEGKLLFVTDLAKTYITLKPDENILEHGESWLSQLFKRVQLSGRPETSSELLNGSGDKMAVPFQIHATPIPTSAEPENRTAVIFYLQDISHTLKQQEFEHRILIGFSTYFKELVQDILLADYIMLNGECGPVNEKQQELLVDIREKGGKIADGISEIANCHLDHVGGGKSSPGQCRPQSVLMAAVERFKPVAAHAEINISAEYDPQLTSVQISKEKLDKIIGQLFENALHFTPTGGTIYFAAGKSGGYVEFSVADSGPGIPGELREKIFEPFFNDTDEERRGLGLCIVKSMVLSAGGSIGIREREGGGTIVYFLIPEQDGAAGNQNSSVNEETLNEETLC